MKKLLLAIFIISVTSLSLQAQKNGDKLFLKNGSEIVGSLIEYSESVYKIKTADGSLYVYPAGEVEKVELNSHEEGDLSDSHLGFGLEAGILIGAQKTSYEAPFSFNILLNYYLSERHIFAAGTGIDFLGTSYTPVFAEYRTVFNNNTTAPFGFIRGGYEFFSGTNEEDDYYGNDRKYSGGLTFTIGTGINWRKSTHSTYLSFAYRYIRTKYEQEEYTSSVSTYYTNWNRLEVKFGFRF